MASSVFSEAGARSRVDNLTLTTSVLDSEERSLIFASEWYFKPEGRTTVEKRFVKYLKKEGLIAQHIWDQENQMFRVRCLAADVPKVWKLFSRIMEGIIRAEIKEGRKAQDDPYDSEDSEDLWDFDDDYVKINTEKIQRLSDWKKEQGPQATTTNDNILGQISEEKYPDAIKFYKFKYIWSCIDENQNSDGVASDDDCVELQHLTNCQLIKSLKQSKIFIGSHSEECLQSCVMRLNNIRKLHQFRSTPYLRHVIYSESSDNVKFCLKPFAFIKRGFFKTTLLECYQDYKALGEAYTARCAFYDQKKVCYASLKKLNISPLVKNSELDPGMKEWAGYKYCENGQLSETAFRHVENIKKTDGHTSPPKPEAIIRVREAGVVTGWFAEAPKIKSQNVQRPASQNVAKYLESLPHLPQGQQIKKGKPSWDTYEEYDPEVSPSKSLMFRIQKEKTSLSDQQQVSIAPSRITNHYFVDETDGLDSFFKPQQETSLLDDSLSNLNFNVLEPTRPTNNTEKVQPIREHMTRVFHTTMNQKAPKQIQNHFPSRLELPEPINTPAPVGKGKCQTLHSDPLVGFQNQLNAAFHAMMTGTQIFRGQIEVKAEFGRIIMAGKFQKNIVSTKESDICHDVDIFNDVISCSTETGQRTGFTPVLTTLSTEVRCLIEMKDSNGHDMWEQETSGWEVVYNFHFSNGKTPLVISVDAERFVTHIKSKQLLGNIFIHAGTKHWDFRIAAACYGSNRVLETQYRKIADTIRENLHVPPDSKRPELYWEMETALNDLFELEKVQVRRVCYYKSKDGRSALKVSEVQAMHHQGNIIPGTKCQLFKATSVPRGENSTDQLSNWYEVSISSAQVDEFFEENQKLELGGEANWTAQQLADFSAAQAMYMPACEMIRKMDGVGYYNDNGIVMNAKPTHEEESPQKEKRPERSFW